MTRILYWNLRNFTRRKIYQDDTWGNFVQSTLRLSHIVDQVISPNPPLPANSPPPPDMIVIAEIYSRVPEVSFQGNVLNQRSNVGGGVLMLLDEIRRKLGNTWCLVPPLMLGDLGLREAVAVYYNAASLQFAGPYIWAVSDNVSLGRPATTPYLAAIADYSEVWRNAMPHPGNPIGALRLNRTWNTPTNVAVNEWQSAGQWEHYTAAGVRINFPYTQNRSPFYTRMLDGAGRTIKVFTVHTSPASAPGGTRNVADIPAVAVAANEVGVVVGDFNVDSFDMNVNGAYVPLLVLGYQMLLDPRDATSTVNLARQPYCLTHLLPVDMATPFNATGWPAPDPQHNVYPRFGYLGSTTIQHDTIQATNSGSIDNALVCYPDGTAAPAHNTTIVNTVVGKPYTAVAPAPVGVGADLTGGYAYRSSLAQPIPVPAGINPAAGAPQFTTWQNFARIASVSDHLAVVFDV